MQLKMHGWSKGAVRGLIVGSALTISVGMGAVIESATPATHTAEASSCSTVFAGRAGTLSTCVPDQNGQDSKVARQVAGRTVTGCVIGAFSGGIAGLPFGCLGGLAANIPW